MENVKGINICKCGHGQTVHKEFFTIEKETPKFYILKNGSFGEIKVKKERDNLTCRREEVREIYTKNAKLIDDDGEVLTIIKDYYKHMWAELVY